MDFRCINDNILSSLELANKKSSNEKAFYINHVQDERESGKVCVSYHGCLEIKCLVSGFKSSLVHALWFCCHKPCENKSLSIDNLPL